MTTPVHDPLLKDAELLESLQQIWDEAQAEKDARAKARLEPALVRLWDGNWTLRGRVAGEISAEFRWVLNNTGTASIVLPADHHLAKWCVDHHSRGTKNVHVTCDKDGARWAGIIDRVSSRKTESGERIVELSFVHVYEHLKKMLVWSNPVLPSAIQFPRTFMLAGPSIWCLKTALFLNAMRLQNALWTLPDNPLDFGSWGASLDMRNWPVTVRGGSLLGDSSPHTILDSRFKTWHELAEPILADAQLMVTAEVWLEGDPQPWPGYTPRNGQIIFDIVDKSGWWGSTGTGGNILQGILRTVMQLGDNLVDMDRSIVADPNRGPRQNDWLGTAPGAPWVVLRDGELTGIESSEFSWQPATVTQIVVGGHSMPGVNEIISSAVQLAGDLASSVFLAANVNLGQIADTVLKPLYTDTLLAWMNVKLFGRAQDLGWSHLMEGMPSSNADRAYTLSSLMAIRRGAWETRERIGHKVKIADGAPYLVGQNGRGHFFLGDRIATTIPGVPDGKLVVDQVSELELAWDRSSFGWEVTVGDLHATESGLDQIVSKIASGASALHTLGVI